MAVALVLFLLGSKYYTKNMPTGNIFAQFLGATWTALRGKCKGMVSIKHPKDQTNQPIKMNAFSTIFTTIETIISLQE